MKRFVCSVCGYVHEGESAPQECPVCHQPAEKFREEPLESDSVSTLDLESAKAQEQEDVSAMEFSYDKNF